MANVTKQTVIKLLVKRGFKQKDAEKMVSKYYDVIRRGYGGKLSNSFIANGVSSLWSQN